MVAKLNSYYSQQAMLPFRDDYSRILYRYCAVALLTYLCHRQQKKSFTTSRAEMYAFWGVEEDPVVSVAFRTTDRLEGWWFDRHINITIDE